MVTRRLTAYISVAVIAILVVGFAWLLASKSLHVQGAANPANRTAIPYGCSQDISTIPTTPGVHLVGATGYPAIVPHLSGDVGYTTDDAKAYVIHAASPASAIPIAIHRADFMTSEQSCIILQGIQSGEPSQQLVCLVTYSGSFKNGTLTQGYDIFDAKTGNLLAFSS